LTYDDLEMKIGISLIMRRATFTPVLIL